MGVSGLAEPLTGFVIRQKLDRLFGDLFRVQEMQDKPCFVILDDLTHGDRIEATIGDCIDIDSRKDPDKTKLWPVNDHRNLPRLW